MGSRLMIFMVLAFVSFFCMNIYGCEDKDDYWVNVDGVSWKCTACGKHCWSNSRDWKGNYYCNSCGKPR